MMTIPVFNVFFYCFDLQGSALYVQYLYIGFTSISFYFSFLIINYLQMHQIIFEKHCGVDLEQWFSKLLVGSKPSYLIYISSPWGTFSHSFPNGCLPPPRLWCSNGPENPWPSHEKHVLYFPSGHLVIRGISFLLCLTFSTQNVVLLRLPFGFIL